MTARRSVSLRASQLGGEAVVDMDGSIERAMGAAAWAMAGGGPALQAAGR
jgi:hypothetical protein